MADLSLDELNAAQDVVWDFDVSSSLAEALRSAAVRVEAQVGVRNARKATYGTHFQGYYAELWARNIETANRDARVLASRLRDVAQGVRDLEADARAEQARIDAAREWKRQRDARSGWDKFWEGADVLHLFHGDANPPRIDPIPQMVKSYPAPPLEARGEFVGNKDTGVSSALPDDLRSFTRLERGSNDRARGRLASVQGLVTSFREKCLWGRLSCEPVLAGFSNYIVSNDNDCVRTDVVAANFEAAGGSGVVSSVSNDAIAQSLAANGVSEERPELEIPAVEAIGNPPTSGYANDPVNTATGNFVANEEELRYEGAAGLLGWVRSYSSLSPKIGGHGPGWASFDGCGLQVTDEGAAWTLVDGREVFFPRLGDGFDRAGHENYWLAREGDGFVVSNNGGARWCFSPAGRPTSFTLTDGAAVEFCHEGERLVRIRHLRGRELMILWEGDRIVAVEADDGRRIDYHYEDGFLVEVVGPLGSRRYEWNDEGLIVAVIDADGVVEARNTYDEQGRVVSQTSPFGRVTRFGYLPGRVTVVSDEDGSRSNTWVADARGRVVGITDSDGNHSSMAYDQWGNQVLATDPEGNTTARQFDDRGRLIIEQLPSGAVTRLGYDELDRLTEIISLEDGTEVARTSLSYAAAQQQPSGIIDAEGGHTRLQWRDGLLLEATDPTGVRVRFGYDPRGDLVSSTDAEGNTTRLVRDAAGRVSELVKPSGATTRFHYTPAGLLEARIDPDGARWEYRYSLGGRLTAMTDPAGATTELEYGSHGELVALVDPLGRRVEQDCDDLGNINRVQLPDGATWEFTHDAMSRLRHTVDPSGGVWQRCYDQYGRLNETTDPSGVRAYRHHNTQAREITIGDAHASTTVTLDVWGRQIAAILPDGSETRVRYDRCGRPVEYMDAAGGCTRIERDPAGRPTLIRRPSGASIRYDYDQCGRVAGIRNELGFRTTLTYNQDSQLTEELWPTGEKGWTRYDTCGRITARFSPGVGRYSWVYDKTGRVIETRDPRNGLRRFRYDPAGQLVTATAGNGGVTRYTYDLNGRAVTITDPLGAVSHHVFDPMDRCLSTTNPLGAVMEWGYDPAGRLIRSVDADGHVVETAYDQAGLETTTIIDGTLFSHTRRDAAARQVQVEDHSNPDHPVTHVLTYDPRGLLQQHARGDHTTRWCYDPDGRVSGITAPNGAATAYQRDPAGNITQVTHPGLATAILERDQKGRLTRAVLDDAIHQWGYTNGFLTHHTTTSQGLAHTAAMDYTDAGWLSSVTINDTHTRYHYDPSGQLTRAESDTTTNTWTYDPAGRLTVEHINGQVWERTYNAAGQLLHATNGDQTITYTHDHTGRRTTETHNNGNHRDYTWTALSQLATITTHHNDQVHHTTTVVDALGHLAHINNHDIFTDPTTGTLLQAGNHNVITAGALTATTNHGWLQPSWRPHRHTHPSDPYQPPTPHTTLANGTLGLGSAGDIHIQGLEWLGARILDPHSRGFLTPDPLPPITGTAWAPNPYNYAGNNPTNLHDPTGLQPITTEQLDAYRKANSPKWGTALAIAAGAALTIFGGPAGIAAAVAIGAGLGAGGSLIDQACSGYPIDWKQVGLSGALGALGGGIGALAGSLIGPLAGQAFPRLAGTPLGQRALQAGIGGTTGGISGFITGGIAATTTGGNFWQGALQGAKDGATSGIAGGAVARTPARVTPTPEAPTRPSIRFNGDEAEVCTTSSKQRVESDIEIDPVPPRALDLHRPISRSETQNDWKKDRIAYLESIEANEIRVDQQQVNLSRERVGINRPDIQYSHGSRRYYEEVDRSNSNRGKDHANRILANDPDGIVYLWTVD